MAYQRRRQHYYQRFRVVIPVFSAVAAALLFLFALLSFLAPSPVETDRMQLKRQQTTVLFLSREQRFLIVQVIDRTFLIVLFCFMYGIIVQISVHKDEAIEHPAFRVPVRAFHLLASI